MSDEDVKDLDLESIIGFDGKTIRGLNIHPDGIHFVYPLGCKVVIQNWKTKKQVFLSGHTNAISAIAISPDGKYVASGQINHMGFKACVILWNFEKCKPMSKYELHKVRVESVTFTCDSKYLISLGGRDDSNIIVWNINKGEALCGSIASRGSSGDAILLCRTNLRGLCFVTGGEGTMRVWKILADQRQTQAMDVKFGLVKRHIICMVIDEWDTYAYCGTTTGDIAKIKLNYDADEDVLDPVVNPILVGCYGKYVNKKKLASGEEPPRYSQGVTALQLWPFDMEGRIFVGGGDGTIELVKERSTIDLPSGGAQRNVKRPTLPQLTVLKSTSVDTAVTSLQLLGEELFVGTMRCEIFTVNIKTFDVRLHVTCHKNAVYDIAFPHEYSAVFATCSKDDIRIWNTSTSQELLRITVPNFTCTGIQFASDGKSIVSGWNDGEIRTFTPETGRLIYAIHNAHNKGVTAIAMTNCGTYIVSGGGEGQVRVWEVRATYQKLEGILQEHKAPVSCIRISKTDKEAVSASSDGTCVIWDLERMIRKHSLFANTQFMGVCYHPSGVEVITTGTDRKIGYWEVYDGSLIREIEGSGVSGLNAIDITRNGEYILTGGNDQYVKIWNYHQGIPTHIAFGHAGVITAVKFSPDNRHIITVSSDGGIFRWTSPYITEPLPPSRESTRCSSRSTRSTCSEREEAWRQQEEQGGDENIEQLKTHSESEKQPECTCLEEEEDGPGPAAVDTPKRNGTPKGGDSSEGNATPKSGKSKYNGSSKSIGMPNRNDTAKESNRISSSNGTPKSNGIPKDNISKSSGTPKLKGSQKRNSMSVKHNGTPKSSVTVKSNNTPNGFNTPKSKISESRKGTPKDDYCNCIQE